MSDATNELVCAEIERPCFSEGCSGMLFMRRASTGVKRDGTATYQTTTYDKCFECGTVYMYAWERHWYKRDVHEMENGREVEVWIQMEQS